MKRSRQQQTIPLPRSERDARDVETRRLRRLAKRISKAASLVDVAATYHEDAAFDTARTRLRSALAELTNACEYLAYEKWHDKQWREQAARDTQ